MAHISSKKCSFPPPRLLHLALPNQMKLAATVSVALRVSAFAATLNAGHAAAMAAVSGPGLPPSLKTIAVRSKSKKLACSVTFSRKLRASLVVVMDDLVGPTTYLDDCIQATSLPRIVLLPF